METLLKLGQVTGAWLLVAGVASCTMKSGPMALLFIAGAVLLGVCRLAILLRRKDEHPGT